MKYSSKTVSSLIKLGGGGNMYRLGGLALAGLLALLGFLPMTSAEDISGTKTINGGTTTATNYQFTGTNGVLNFNTMKADGSSNDHIHYNGTLTTATGASGTINIYGNKNQSNTGPAVWFSSDLSGFTGTVTIGEATSTTLTRDWAVFESNAKGSENAHWVFNTGTNSGILLNAGPVKFGSLSGSGITRGNTTVTVGKATTATDVDVFDGLFSQSTDQYSCYTVEKTGAGTWIWTGNIIPDLTKVTTTGGVYASNQIGTLKVSGGTLQIGDYGHVYTEGNLYYAKGATGDGKLGKGVAGTGSVDVSAILATKYHATRQKEDKTWEAYEVASNAIQISNATLAFGLATDTTVTNDMKFTNGALSNVNPNTTITLTGALTGTGLTLKDGKFLVTGASNTVDGYTIAAGATLKFPAGTVNTRTYTFAATDAVLDVTTVASDGSTKDTKFSAAISSSAAGYGKIFVHGNGDTGGQGLYVYNNLANFKGTIQIGEAVRDGGKSRNWLVIDSTDATGSQYATLDLRTKADSGVLVKSSKTVNFGSVIGSGIIRVDSGTCSLSVGALLANATDSAVFHGYLTNGGSGSFNVNKVGAGTWVWSGKLTGSGKINQLGTVNVQAGTIQVGDLNYVYGDGDLYYTKGAKGDGSGALGNLLGNGTVKFAEGTQMTFALASDATTASKFDFTNGGSVSNLNPNKTITLSGAISGNANFQSGKFKLTNATISTNITTGSGAEVTIQPYVAGQFVFNGEGRVILTNGFAETPGTTLTINGGTVVAGAVTYTRTFPITVNEGGTLEFAKDRTGDVGVAMTFNGGTLRSLKETDGKLAEMGIVGTVSGTGIKIDGGLFRFKGAITVSSFDIEKGTVIFPNNVSLTSVKSLELGSGATIQIEKPHTIGGNNPITATLTANGGTICTVQNVTFTGKATGSLIKTGAMTLAFNNTENTLTKVTIKEGTFNTNQGTLNVVMDGGNLNNGSETVNVEATANGGTIYYSGTYSLASLKNAAGVESAQVTLSRSNAQAGISQGTNMGGSLDSINSGFAKDFNGIVNVADYAIVSFGLEKSGTTIVNSDYTKITMNLNTKDDAYSGIYLARPGLKAQFGAITGDGLVMTGVSGRTGTFTLQVGAKIGEGETVTFNGAFADKATGDQAGKSTLNVEKVGDGAWVFGQSTKSASSIDNYLTNLTVSGGEMVLARNSGLSSADYVTVKDDATLTLASSGQEIAKTLTLNSGSTLNFDLSTDSSKSGSLKVETLTMDPTSTVELSYDEAFIESLTPGLTLKVMDLGTANPTWNAKFTEAFNDSGLGNYFNLNPDGSIVVDGGKIPEPSAWLLLLLGIPFLRRRK